MHHPTNWLMRILLVVLSVALVIVVPTALGAEGLDAQVSAGADLGSDATTEIPPVAEQVEQEADARTRDLPVSTETVKATVDEAATTVTETAPTVQTESAGDLTVVTRPTTKAEVATTGAAVATVAASAGVLFWLKNAIGLGLGRFLGAPLFSRLSKDELLENDGRETLFQLVDQNPGIGLADLAGQSGLGWGTAVYHLGRLEQAGFITSMKNGQARHFFKNGHPAAQSKKAVAILKNTTAAQVARFLVATPGATGKTIAAGLGIAPPTVTKYVQRLEAEGLVETLKDGRSKIVQPTQLLTDALGHIETPVERPVEVPVALGREISAYA